MCRFIFFLNPGPRELDTVRKKVAQHLVDQTVYNIPEKNLDKTCVVVPLGNDPSGEITDMMRSSLAATGKVSVPRSFVIERVLKELNMEIHGTTDVITASQLGMKCDADWVLFGHVKSLEQNDSQASGSMEISLLDMNKEEIIQNKQYEWQMNKSIFSPSFAQMRIQESSFWARLFCWIVIALALPWAAIALVKKILEAESNVYNAMMLLGLTALDIAFALMLLGFHWTSFWALLLLLIATLIAGFYNYRACNFIESLES